MMSQVNAGNDKDRGDQHSQKDLHLESRASLSKCSRRESRRISFGADALNMARLAELSLRWRRNSNGQSSQYLKPKKTVVDEKWGVLVSTNDEFDSTIQSKPHSPNKKHHENDGAMMQEDASCEASLRLDPVCEDEFSSQLVEKVPLALPSKVSSESFTVEDCIDPLEEDRVGDLAGKENRHPSDEEHQAIKSDDKHHQSRHHALSTVKYQSLTSVRAIAPGSRFAGWARSEPEKKLFWNSFMLESPAETNKLHSPAWESILTSSAAPNSEKAATQPMWASKQEEDRSKAFKLQIPDGWL
mmetsp:Transcript_25217/g.44059  ORF Transcript_25217/g.44059 Transcript_25217/m.44059 type:complete len:300 (-) Transcript_25217:571-1470(-)